MTVCEHCGGCGWTVGGVDVRLLCQSCAGTGMLALGPESVERWQAMRRIAREKAAREGWLEVVWEGEPGNARKVRQRVTLESSLKQSA